ncbi:hypothetical protein TruAng_007154 [Truncatella angustata]|nr:hypothetical protein TruAng_007154 [Truncatella angustata]
MAGNDLSIFTLNDTDSTKIFEQQIVPEELKRFEEQRSSHICRETPLAVFVVGQTGAGKTLTAPAIKEVIRARRGEPAHFIADTYKTYHPGYSRLLAERPALASPATGTDARRWLSMAAAYAIERRIDVLVESACRHPQDFADLAQAFHLGRYRVEVAIMAVPEALSRLGILTRFYERLPEAGSRGLPVRLTPRRVHDESLNGLVEAAQFVDAALVVDQVVVLRRDNLVAYSNERIGGVWKEPAITAETLLFERQRPLPEREQVFSIRDLKSLHSREAGGLLPQLDEIRSLLNKLEDGSSARALRHLVLPVISADVSQHDDVVPDLRLGLHSP